nr:Pyridoxal phosphate-dependent decarboxylase domain containing protein [Haemonchus contortus]
MTIDCSDRSSPDCVRNNSDGQVVFSTVTASGVKYGSIFDDSFDDQEGSVNDLLHYLDSITIESAEEHEVGDRYTGVKEHVSLSDPIPVPVPVAVVVALLILIILLITAFLCVKKPAKSDVDTAMSKRKSTRPESDESSSKRRGRRSQSRMDKSSRSQSERSRKKSDKSHSDSTKGSGQEKPLNVGSAEKMLPSPAGSTPLMKKGNSKKRDSELKLRDLAEVIKQPLTSREFEVYLNRLAHFAIEYYNDPTVYDVTPNVSPGFLYNTMPKNCPENPETFNDIFEDIKLKIMPGLTHWQHPNFFAYYPIGRCFPDLLADFVTSALSVIGFSWDSCPALTEMENAMVNWVGRALGFPEAFLFQDSPPASQGGGTVTESGSDAILCAVLAARQWKINQVIEEQQRRGGSKFDTVHDIGKRLVVYSSKDAHSCIEKACKLAMLRCRPIQPLEENQWGITGEQIEAEIKKDLEKGLIPCFINCTLGTSSTASCDKLTSICPVSKKYDTWLHVDAAYAGSTFIDTKFREVAEGIENAHTINVNLSKFLLHSATLSIIWTREQKIYKDAFSITPMYLKPSHASSTDLRDWGLHLSRRFKALKVWFIMRMCGVEGLRRHVNRICDMASYFESLIDQHPNLQIFTTRNFGLFTFQYSEPSFTKEERNRHTLRLLCFLNDSHKIYFTPVRVDKEDLIQFSENFRFIDS